MTSLIGGTNKRCPALSDTVCTDHCRGCSLRKQPYGIHLHEHWSHSVLQEKPRERCGSVQWVTVCVCVCAQSLISMDTQGAARAHGRGGLGIAQVVQK